ncbi:Translation initiation factor 2, alpha subunit like protein, partial [Aduncisulcus paluster]
MSERKQKLRGETQLAEDCRMYKNPFPAQNQNVVCKVEKITDTGVYVRLLEYAEMKAMLQFREISRKRVRSLKKVGIIEGAEDVVSVMRVDESKGNVDVSKRDINDDDKNEARAKYAKSKAVHNIFRNIAYKAKLRTIEVYTLFGWPLADEYDNVYDGLLVAINEAGTFERVSKQAIEELTERHDLDPEEKASLEEKAERLLPILYERVKDKLAPSAVKFHSLFRVTCFNEKGITAIKDSVSTGLDFSTPEAPIKITLLSSPMFLMVCQSKWQTTALENMKRALSMIEKSIVAHGGAFVLDKGPHLASDKEQTEMKKRISRIIEMTRE